MQTRTWTARCLRLVAVTTSFGLWFVSGQYFAKELGQPYDPWYGSPEPTATHWLTNFSYDKIDIFMGYLFGFLVMIFAAVALGGLCLLARWIWRGPSDYVDPCDDPDCPCLRHEEERRQAELARTAIIAGTTAAITSSIVSN